MNLNALTKCLPALAKACSIARLIKAMNSFLYIVKDKLVYPLFSLALLLYSHEDLI